MKTRTNSTQRIALQGLRAFLATTIASLCAFSTQAQITVTGGVQAQAKAVERPPIATPRQTFVHPLIMDPIKLCGWISIDTRKRFVRVDWSYDQQPGERDFFVERIDIDFWPTAAARVNDTRLNKGSAFVVCGVKPTNGHTVVELWTPSFTGIPSDATPTTFTREVVYSGDVAGKRIVRQAAPTVNKADHVLLQFSDSGDLYLMEPNVGSLQLSYSSGQEPELSKVGYERIGGGVLASGDVAYIYTCDYNASSNGALLLVDTNADGIIDSHTAYSYADVVAGAVDAIPWQSHFDS